VRSTASTHFAFATSLPPRTKRERGFERRSTGGGRPPRIREAVKARTGPRRRSSEHLELMIMQLVHLVRAGERAQSPSARGGSRTLDDCSRRAESTRARWYMLAIARHDRRFDLEMAREESAEEPRLLRAVRACAESPRLSRRPAPSASEAPEGRDRRRANRCTAPSGGWASSCWPSGRIAEERERRAPHRITSYALELSQGFHAFTRRRVSVRVRGDRVLPHRTVTARAGRR